MLKGEVNYRLAKWMLGNLKNQGVITDDEMHKACKLIAEYYNSPFRELENFGEDTETEVKADG